MADEFDFPIRLDIDSAVQAAGELWARFTAEAEQASQQAAASVNEALGGLDAGVTVDVTNLDELPASITDAVEGSDPSVDVTVANLDALTSETTGAIEAADPSVTATVGNLDSLTADTTAAVEAASPSVDAELADPGALTSGAEDAVAAADGQVSATLTDPGAITSGVEAAVADADAGVAATLIDPSSITNEIESAIADADLDAGLTVDVANLDELQSSVIDAVEGAEPGIEVTVANLDELASETTAAVESAEPAVTASIGNLDALTTDATEAVEAAAPAVDAHLADPGGLTQEATAGVEAAQPVVEVHIGNLDDLASAIVSALADVDGGIQVQVTNLAEVTDSIEGAIGDADTTIVAEVDAAGAEQLNQLGESAQDAGAKADTARGGFDRLAASSQLAGGAAAAARADFNGVAQAGGTLSPVLAGVAGGVVALVGVLGEMTQQAAQAENAARLMDRTFGELRGSVETIDVGGLNEQLSDLALRMGSDDDAIRVILSRLGDLAQQTGATSDEVEAFTDGIVALSARAVALNPNLGSMEDVANRLGPALLRGGRFAQELGISLSDAEVAAEAAREGITGLVSDLTPVEQQMLKVNAAVNKLGTSIRTDVDAGAASATISFRAFRQSLQEELEASGADILPLVRSLTEDLQPVLLNLIRVIGQVGTAVLSVIGPVAEAIGPPLAEALGTVGKIMNDLQPLFELIGTALGEILPVVIDITAFLAKWATPLGLAITLMEQAAGLAKDVEKGFSNAFLGAGKSVQELGRELGLAATEVDTLVSTQGLSNFTDMIQTAQAGAAAAGLSLEQWGQAADRAGVAVDDVAAITAKLNEEHQIQLATVGDLSIAYDQYTQGLDASTGSTGSFFDAISASQQAIRDTGAPLLELRDNADQAFFALLKIGDTNTAELMRELALSFERGGLSADEFTATAERFGLSLDDLAAVEQRARENADQLGQEVSKALGGISDATKELSDEGKANIESFVAEMETQLEAAANFSNNIAVLFASGAETLAQAFLEAGPEAAGALQDLVDQGGPAISEFERRLEDAATTAEEASGRAVTAAKEQAAGVTHAFEDIRPDGSVIRRNVDEAMLEAQAALADARSGISSEAHAIGSDISGGIAGGINSGLGGIIGAATRAVQAALAAARGEAQIRSPSRLFADDVGFPLSQGIAEGIVAGMFEVEDAIAEVIEGAQRQAQDQLDSAFGALSAGQSLVSTQRRLNDLQAEQASLLARQASLPADMAAAQRELNLALQEAAVITAREEQSIQRAQDAVDRIQAQLSFQSSTGPQQLDQAQRQLALDQADLDRLRASLQQQQNNAVLGTGDPEALRAAQQAFNQQQQAVSASQRTVDQLTQQLKNNRVSQIDLQVAVEDLTAAQQAAVAPTDAVRDAEQKLKDLEDEARQVKRDLVDVTRELPAAQLALLESTAAAAKAGDAFNQTGLQSIEVLGDIAKQAGFTEGEIRKLTETWAGLASSIATNLGGSAFGGQVDIGSIINPSGGPRFVSQDQALAELNFVRGLNQQGPLTMQQAPWAINIYQANDPIVVAQAIATRLGLAGVR